MNIAFDGYNTLTIKRESTDPKFYNGGWGSGESRLFYALKQLLNQSGYDLIKKRMGADGHLVDDEQQYLRSRGTGTNNIPHIEIWDGEYAVRNAAEEWNTKGEVRLMVVFDIFEKQGETVSKQLFIDRLGTI